MRFGFLFLVFLTSCSAPEKKIVSPSLEPVSKPALVAGPIHLKPAREVVLDNGLKVIFVRDQSLPRISLMLMVKAGIREEVEGKGGINAVTAQLLEQGTANKNANQVADAFAELGTEFSVTPGDDATLLSSDGLSTSSEELLNLFYEVISSPSFKEDEIKRMKSQFLASIKKRIDNPSAMIEVNFQNVLFEGHPYSRALIGDEKSLAKIKKQDIVKHYLNWYRPNNSELAVVGSFGDSFEKKVAETFRKWPQRPLKKIVIPQLSNLTDLKMKVFSKPGLAQTQIRIGQRGVPRQNSDYLKLKLANEILGGGFVSRLNQKIRDDLGLTYSVGSFMDARLDRGSLGISTFTKNESVAQTINEALKVLEEYVSRGVTENELRAAKNLLIGQFPKSVETADRVATNYLFLDLYGIPRTYLTNYYRNIEEINLGEVNEVIKKYYSSRFLRIVIYGDEKLIGEQLKSYSPEVIQVN